MVFIDKVKNIIKLFEDSSRRDIGISLLAYEQFISKGLKVSDKDLERLTKIFDYYDKELSDDFPSLTNEVLQNVDTLINNFFNDTKNIIKDEYKITANLSYWNNDTTNFDVEISDKTGYLYSNFKCSIDDKTTNSNYYKDSFNTIYNACEEVNKKINELDIKSILDTFRL